MGTVFVVRSVIGIVCAVFLLGLWDFVRFVLGVIIFLGAVGVRIFIEMVLVALFAVVAVYGGIWVFRSRGVVGRCGRRMVVGVVG